MNTFQYIVESIDVSGLSTSAEISEKILSEIFQKYGETASENLYKISICNLI